MRDVQNSAVDTRLWCLHHIGPDDVYPAPDFATAQAWADYANAELCKGFEDISRFVVAIWPWDPEGHADNLAHSIAGWVLPTPAPSDQAGNSYLVWSNEHKAWWGPEHRGYTCIIANAGRYDRAEALKIAGTRDGGWWLNKGNPDEIAIPEQDAIDQYADITRVQEATAPTLTAGEANHA